jgi:dipeptide/tripeptide permease
MITTLVIVGYLVAGVITALLTKRFYYRPPYSSDEKNKVVALIFVWPFAVWFWLILFVIIIPVDYLFECIKRILFSKDN